MKSKRFILYDRISYIIFCISGAILLINLSTYNYFGIWTTIISFLIMLNVLVLRLVAFAYLDYDDDDYIEEDGEKIDFYNEYYEEEYPDNDFKDDNYPI